MAGGVASPPMTDLGRLGRYTLLRRLAAGGMGEVYLGEVQGAANFTRRVAIKRILPHLARNEDFVSKFIDEAHLMVQLHHGNIVPVQELNDEDGELYIVMEYLPGRDLKAIIRRLKRERQTMAPDLAVWLCSELCAGLDYAHHKVDADGRCLDIVHRDVSPSNVVLGAGGEIKLLDFGIARARGGLHQSISGTLQGKFVYMSPEQADGRPVGPRADIFSAGLILYELLTGTRPFDAASETQTLRLARECKIKPPSAVCPQLPEAIDALVMRALEPQADRRWSTAGEFRRALLSALSAWGSATDARTLAALLRSLFPEGVVPSDSPQAPMSVDEALNMQLGALTPSVGALTRTVTQTGPSSARRPISTSVPGGYARRATDPGGPNTPTVAPTLSTTHPPTSTTGRKRLIFLGLAIGVIATAAVLLFSQSRGGQTVPVEPIIVPAGLSGVVLTRGPNGPQFDSGERFPVGQQMEICATADDRIGTCKTFTTHPGRNPVLPELLPVPKLVPTASPAVPFRLTANGRGLPPPYRLNDYRATTVCIKIPDPDLEPEIRCHTVTADKSTGRATLDFVVVPSEAARARVDAPPEHPLGPDAAVQNPTADASTKRRRPRVTTSVRLEMDPASTSVRCSAALKGRNLSTAKTVKCRFEAKGRWPVSRTFAKGETGLRKVALRRPGTLSGRLNPPSARLRLDGTLIPSGRMNARAVDPAVSHVVTGEFEGTRKRVRLKVAPGGKATFFIDLVKGACTIDSQETACE